MDNLDALKKVFSEVLELKLEDIKPELEYGNDWDSLTHLILIGKIESKFDVMIDTMDVVDMSSFAKAKEILAKYNVVF